MGRTKRKVWTTRERVIEELKTKADELGHSPSSRDLPYLIEPATRMFGTWNNAKRAAGLEVYAQKRKRTDLREAMRNYLRGNPSTFAEMEQEIEGISRYIVYSTEGILPIGPRRNRVYYLDEDGQEELASKKLEELELEALLNETKKMGHILSCLDRPMGLGELHEKTQLPISALKDYLKFLIEENDVIRVDNFTIYELHGTYNISSIVQGRGGRGGRSYIYYKPGQEKLFAEDFKMQLPPSREIDRFLKHKITKFIKRYPDPLEEEIKELYVGIKQRKRGKTEDGRRKRKRQERETHINKK